MLKTIIAKLLQGGFQRYHDAYHHRFTRICGKPVMKTFGVGTVRIVRSG